MGSLSLITAPTEPVLSIQEASAHCRIDLPDEDALIDGYVAAATQHVQSVTGRQLLTATYELRLDGWPCWIDVPRAPLLGVTSVQYVDTSGTTQTLATSQYLVDKPAGPTAARGRIERAYLVTWPTLRCQPHNVRVTFTAGYGTTPDTVPAALRLAIGQLVAHWYKSRESVNVGNITSKIPLSTEALIGPYRTWARQRGWV